MYNISLVSEFSFTSSNIYLLGGQNTRQKYLGMNHQYNVKTGNLVVKKPMINPRIKFGTLHFDKYILCAGGMQNEYQTFVEAYFTTENEWRILPNFKYERNSVSLIASSNFIYIVGEVTKPEKRRSKLPKDCWTFERYSIKSLIDASATSEWDSFDIKTDLKLFTSWGVFYHECWLLIFGGEKSDKTYKVDLREKTVSHSSPIQVQDKFSHSIAFEDTKEAIVTIIGDTYIHRLKLENLCWRGSIKINTL